MANKQLTASVKLNTSDFERKLKRISKGIDALNNAIGKQANAYKQVNSALGKAEKTTRQVKSSTDRWAESQRKVNLNLQSNNSILGGIGSKLKAIASTYLGIMGMKAMIGTSDILTSTQNKLNTLNSGDSDLTQEQMDKMYASANKVRMAYTDMAANASKSMTLAGEAFNGNMDNAIRFQEIMAETYALGGASAEEMSSSMYQLIQALGAGTLAGDELRSVREGAPLAYKEIEKFAQGIYKTTKSLKELAAEGMITSELVVAAVMDAGKDIDKQFENTYWTFGQAWDRIKNSAVKAFEPVSKMLNKMLNDAANNGAFEKIEQSFADISKAIQIAFTLIKNGVNWVVDNWEIIDNVVISGLSTLLTVLASVAVASAVNFVIAHAKLIAIATAIFIVIYALSLVRDGIIDMQTAIMIIAAVMVAAFLVMGIAMGQTWLIWVGVIIGILAIAFWFFGEIMGGLTWLGGLVVNIWWAVSDFVVACFEWMKASCHNVGEKMSTIATNIGIAFQNAWIGAKNMFWSFIENCLIGLSDLEPAINSIVQALGGEGFTLTGLIDTVSSKQQELLEYQEPTNLIDRDQVFQDAVSKHNAFADGWGQEAFDRGYDFGTGVQDAVNKWGSETLGNATTGLTELFDLDKIGEKLGLDFSGITDGFPNSGTTPLDVDELFNNVGDIANNTGDVADAVELTQQDLEYLRRIADMEWKKEYTTANIKIDMSNYNTVNGDGDLDGIVTRLADKLYEEMSVVANGVYV